jgi:hypothetical protein
MFNHRRNLAPSVELGASSRSPTKGLASPKFYHDIEYLKSSTYSTHHFCLHSRYTPSHQFYHISWSCIVRSLATCGRIIVTSPGFRSLAIRLYYKQMKIYIYQIADRSIYIFFIYVSYRLVVTVLSNTPRASWKVKLTGTSPRPKFRVNKICFLSRLFAQNLSGDDGHIRRARTGIDSIGIHVADRPPPSEE